MVTCKIVTHRSYKWEIKYVKANMFVSYILNKVLQLDSNWRKTKELLMK